MPTDETTIPETPCPNCSGQGSWPDGTTARRACDVCLGTGKAFPEPDREDGDDAPEGRFEINSEERANWLLRKIANLEAERGRVKAMTAEMLGDIDREEARLRARFESDLAAWARAELARRGGRSKTLKLHHGVLAWRTVPPAVKVVSPTEALNYGRERGWDVVKVTETLDAAAYRQQAEAALKESGELIPGVEVTPERESFAIRFPSEKDRGSAEPAGE